MAEKNVSDEIRKLIGSIPSNLILRTNVGLFYTKDGREIYIGRKGQSDLIALIGDQKCWHCDAPIHHLPVMIETKFSNNKQSENQVKFEKEVCIRRGIIYILARSVKDVEKIIDSSR